MSKTYSTDWDQAAAVLDEARVLHLALSGADGPYCVPLNFARAGKSLYLHCGTSGKKLDMLRADPRVSFAAQAGLQLKISDQACKWGYSFRSVIGFGSVRIVEDEAERRHGLEVIIRKWTGELQPVNEKIFAAKTLILRIDVDSATLRVND